MTDPKKTKKSRKRAKQKCYKLFRERVIAKNRQYYENRKNRAIVVVNEKKEKGCSICGEKRFPCLQFHHVNPKEKKYTIGYAIERLGMEKLNKEISKCVILCANCHFIEHSKERTPNAKIMLS